MFLRILLAANSKLGVTRWQCAGSKCRDLDDKSARPGATCLAAAPLPVLVGKRTCFEGVVEHLSHKLQLLGRALHARLDLGVRLDDGQHRLQRGGWDRGGTGAGLGHADWLGHAATGKLRRLLPWKGNAGWHIAVLGADRGSTGCKPRHDGATRGIGERREGLGEWIHI